MKSEFEGEGKDADVDRAKTAFTEASMEAARIKVRTVPRLALGWRLNSNCPPADPLSNICAYCGDSSDSRTITPFRQGRQRSTKVRQRSSYRMNWLPAFRGHWVKSPR